MSGSLRLEGVSLSVAGHPVIGPVTLEVEPGEVVTLMGPSGCGKSSLLAFVSGSLDPAFTARGRALLDGRDLGGLAPERRQVGMLFQDDLLFPHLSVGENLAFGLPAAVRGRGARAARVDAALADAGLAGFAARDPATLSGGQRARVALMRTLLAEPKALLLDEPFGKLDAALRDQMRGFVFSRARAAGVPTLLVTHDPGDAEAAGGRVVVLESGVGIAGDYGALRRGSV